MSRRSSTLSWTLLALGIVLGVVSVVATSGVRTTIAAISTVEMGVVGWWALRPPAARLYRWLAVLGAGTCTVAVVASPTEPTLHSLGAVLAVVATGAVLTLALLNVAKDSITSIRGVIGDTLIVAVGSWIVGWAVFIRHLVDRDGLSLSTGLYMLFPPLAATVAFLALTTLAFREERTTAHLLTAGGVIALSISALVRTAADARWTGAEGLGWSCLLLLVGASALNAAMVHPSSGVACARVPTARPDALARMLVIISALTVPIVVLAFTSPIGQVDRVIRGVSAVTLSGAVIVRAVAALRANERARVSLIHGAQTDPLTGLPNRQVVIERLTALLRQSWNEHEHPTLHFIDLDRFKNINDSLGHAVGDEVLVTVARRLEESIPERATVARLSGDEYVVLDPSSSSAEESLALAQRLLSVLHEPLPLSKGDVFVTASIGVASLSATSSTSPEDLLRHADTAMYRAKDAGRNGVAVYDESMHERVAHRLSVETALYRALDRHELRLFHQPILDLHNGDVVGFEALMRWQQTDGTIVSPAEFIPIAEDTGTIIPIGSWALLEALNQLRTWIDEGVCSSHCTMSVNVSPRQLSDVHFPAVVGEALSRSRVSPQLLWLEVTEGVMIAEPELALATLRRLRSLGVRVAIDDFGTGYSSLSLLQKFPLQRLKIDRAFVHGVAENPNDRSLVRTIVAMGKSLGLDIVAEGVETVHQLQVLTDLGCMKAQGYLISHPVPADAMRSTVSALERLGNVPGLREPARAETPGHFGFAAR